MEFTCPVLYVTRKQDKLLGSCKLYLERQCYFCFGTLLLSPEESI